MCGRTALNLGEEDLRAELARVNVNINQILNQPVWRRTHNVAPTYVQPVIRQLGGDRNDPPPPPASDLSDHEAMENSIPRFPTDSTAPKSPRTTALRSPKSPQSPSKGKPGDLIVQSMKWGLIPFWTKRAPDFPSVMRTINCRDDSLFENRGMWNSIKGRKRCIIPVMGYYEWLKKGKDKVPHFTKRADGTIMLLAGLWDSVQYEGTDERIYTYTIITTSSAKSVSFLHDRMPVILEPNSTEMKKWLDPHEPWSPELAKILKPYEGELTCYPVKKEVGKVGEDSPLFIVPLDSTENKSNIANFFSKSISSSPSKPKTISLSKSPQSSSPSRSKVTAESQESLKSPDSKGREITSSASTIKVDPVPNRNSPVEIDIDATGITEEGIDRDAGEDTNSETHAPGKRKVEEMAEEEGHLMASKVKVAKSGENAMDRGTAKGQSPVKTAQRKPTKRGVGSGSGKKGVLKKEGNKITSFFK